MSREKHHGLQHLFLVSVFVRTWLCLFPFFFAKASQTLRNFKSPDCQIKLQSQRSVSFIQINGLLCGDWKLWITTEYIFPRHWKQQSYVTSVNISDFDPNLVRLISSSSSPFFISSETRVLESSVLAPATTLIWSPSQWLPSGPPLVLLGAWTTSLGLLTCSGLLPGTRHLLSFGSACEQEQLFLTT